MFNSNRFDKIGPILLSIHSTEAVTSVDVRVQENIVYLSMYSFLPATYFVTHIFTGRKYHNTRTNGIPEAARELCWVTVDCDGCTIVYRVRLLDQQTKTHPESHWYLYFRYALISVPRGIWHVDI